MTKEQLNSAAASNINGGEIPQQVSLEDQVASLKEQLDWRKESEKSFQREMKKEAFKMAIQIKPQPSYNPMGAQVPPANFTTEDLIKSANKIYDELIK